MPKAKKKVERSYAELLEDAEGVATEIEELLELGEEPWEETLRHWVKRLRDELD